MRIVLDTNVLVAGLLNPHGVPGRIVDLVVAGDVGLLVDDRILSEYREILARPRFGFDPGAVEALLAFVEAESTWVSTVPLDVRLPDPGDVAFLEVAACDEAAVLVTGNLRHFPAGSRGGVRVESPAAFLRRFQGG